jgi:hypothetical protein
MPASEIGGDSYFSTTIVPRKPDFFWETPEFPIEISNWSPKSNCTSSRSVGLWATTDSHVKATITKIATEMTIPWIFFPMHINPPANAASSQIYYRVNRY